MKRTVQLIIGLIAVLGFAIPSIGMAQNVGNEIRAAYFRDFRNLDPAHLPGSPDYQALEELKTANAEIARDVTTAWDAAGLPTERNYLRGKIRQARKRQ